MIVFNFTEPHPNTFNTAMGGTWHAGVVGGDSRDGFNGTLEDYAETLDAGVYDVAVLSLPVANGASHMLRLARITRTASALTTTIEDV
jgi:hypothetical protein